MLRLLLDRNSLSGCIKLYDTKTLRIVNVVTKYGCSALFLRTLCGCAQSLLESLTVENIITENHRNGISADEICADDKCLCKSIR